MRAGGGWGRGGGGCEGRRRTESNHCIKNAVSLGGDWACLFRANNHACAIADSLQALLPIQRIRSTRIWILYTWTMRRTTICLPVHLQTSFGALSKVTAMNNVHMVYNSAQRLIRTSLRQQ